MFKYLVLAALLSCAYAVSDNVHAEVKQLDSDVHADGFVYHLETSNSISSGTEGDEYGNIHGHYEYISPEGEHIRVDYVADEPPPVPVEILKALEYLKAHPHSLEYLKVKKLNRSLNK